ncbi:GDSL-type esterase/lipase family protein [Phycisphaeraceae bacterium D3-23]
MMMRRVLGVMCVFVLGMLGCHSAGGVVVDTQGDGEVGVPARVEMDTDRWRGDIDRFLEADRAAYPARGGVLFYGSSTIRLWEVERFFEGRPVTNRGFGGTTLPGVLRYMHLVALPYEPAVIVLYCGTNDIAEGQPVEHVVADFVRFTQRVHEALPGTQVLLLGIAPSVSRWSMWDTMSEANDQMSAYCDDADWLTYVDQSGLLLDEDGEPIAEMFTDGLHMSEAGYALVSALVEEELVALEGAHPSIRRVEEAGGE